MLSDSISLFLGDRRANLQSNTGKKLAVPYHIIRNVGIAIVDSMETNSETVELKVSDLDPVKGFQFDKDGLLEKEIQKEEFHILKGITRLDLPYATLPQQMSNSEKIDWVIQGGMI